MAESEEWSSPRKCAITCALQHLHKWPTQYTTTLGVSSTQTTCVLRHRMHHLRRPESTLSAALDSIGDYYEKNHLRANPDKTQTCVFHLRNRKANRQPEHIMVWKETGTYSHPQYTWELLLTEHLATALTSRKWRRRLQQETPTSWGSLQNSKWGTHSSTIKTTALALCYSTAWICMPSVGKITRTHAQGWPSAERCLPRHHRMPATNQRREIIPSSWYCSTCS